MPSRYQKYMASPEWQKKRVRIMERAGGVCERRKCSRPATQVHHKTYARLDHENDGDLEALCAPCHAREHPNNPDLARFAQRGAFAITDADCFACGHDVALLRLRGPRKLFDCYRCGASWEEERERRRKPPVRIDGEGVCCVQCRRGFQDGYALQQHNAALHGSSKPRPPTKRKRDGMPTLEELERDRREAERTRVLSLKR